MAEVKIKKLVGLAEVEGQYVADIDTRGAFGQLGVREGDLLVSINGRSMYTFVHMEPRNGFPLRLHYVRGGVLVFVEGTDSKPWSMKVRDQTAAADISAISTHSTFYSAFQYSLLRTLEGLAKAHAEAKRKGALASFAAGAALSGAGFLVRQRLQSPR